MTTWVSSSFWRGWVADCGEYIGPWPPAPPIPANVPSGFGVDYFITDMTITDVVDGDAFGIGMDVSRDSAGGSLSGIGRDPLSPVAGGHLFAIIWQSSFVFPFTEPDFDALTLVPPLYVAGGQGTNVGDPRAGSWGTAYAFPDTFKLSNSVNVHPGPREGPLTEQSVGGSGDPGVDVEPLETDMLAAGVPGTPDLSGSSSFAKAELAVTASWPLDGGTEVTGHYAETDLGTMESTFWQWDTLLVVPDGLIEGIDFAANPDTFQPTKAVNDATTAWTDWDQLALDYTTQADHDVDSVPTLYYTLLAFEIVAMARELLDTEWSMAVSATPLDGIDVDYPDAGTAGSDTVPLGGMPATLPLILRPADPATLDVPIANFTTSGHQTRTIEWIIRTITGTVTAVLDYPDLQLWVPPPALAWHNAFGHYAPAGSVPLEIYTPPHGWVPIVDGPA